MNETRGVLFMHKPYFVDVIYCFAISSHSQNHQCGINLHLTHRDGYIL